MRSRSGESTDAHSVTRPAERTLPTGELTKTGGRKKGSRNIISPDHKRALTQLGPSRRVGSDGNGRDGMMTPRQAVYHNPAHIGCALQANAFLPPRPAVLRCQWLVTKTGGRKKGSRNIISPDHKRALLGAVHRVGSDGNGRDGMIGYFTWVGSAIDVLLCGALESTAGVASLRTGDER
jgi:hypothetical protein